MNTQVIAGKTYERRACWCNNGQVYDATNADKVATGGIATGTCSHCRSKGETFHLITPTVSTPPRTPEPIGEIPDWMT